VYVVVTRLFFPESAEFNRDYKRITLASLTLLGNSMQFAGSLFTAALLLELICSKIIHDQNEY
jgi:hypothetical protein